MLEVRVDTPPPKPQRLHRRATPTTEDGSGSEGNQVRVPPPSSSSHALNHAKCSSPVIDPGVLGEAAAIAQVCVHIYVPGVCMCMYMD